jgi:hypothetical protein
MPEGPARDAYVKQCYRHTKVSLTREKARFLKRKKSATVGEITSLQTAYEGWQEQDDDRIGSVDDIDWEDLQQVACVLGEDDFIDPGLIADLRQSSILCGGRASNSRVGMNATADLLKVIHALPKANFSTRDDEDIGAPQLATANYGL